MYEDFKLKKKTLVFMVHTKIFQRSKDKDHAPHSQSIEWTKTSQQTRDVASVADDGRTLLPWRQNTENESNKQEALTQCYVSNFFFFKWNTD